MSNIIKGWAVHEKGGQLTPYEYDSGEIQPNDVEINVEYCGICHSDLAMIDNDFHMTGYPLVPGHEVVGVIGRVGNMVQESRVGQRVGLGWYCGSCMSCEFCINGSQNFCPRVQPTIMGRHGGFADKIRCHSAWAIPVPDGMDNSLIGPLFCAGSTVFNPMFEYVKGTDHVGVIGLGGLGHLAVKFLRAWGCHVTVFSTTPEKENEAYEMGAHAFVNTKAPGALDALSGKFDFILSTLNVELNWPVYVGMLRPMGRLHIVGLAPKVEVPLFSLLGGMKSISSSPVGSIGRTSEMLRFVQTHPECYPLVEKFTMDQVNEALNHLRNGKPRFRIVLSRV